jgi:L-ascorbate metabolism protein UlaG (beta-lactamase superfamily)
VTRRRKTWLSVLGVLVVLLATGAILLSGPQFGGKMTGERLARAQANPQYHDGVFTNVIPNSERKWSDWRELLAKQFGGNEAREPPHPLPVIAVEPASLALSPTPTLRAFWIGHSSAYIELDGVRFLIDPIFSDYASPFPLGPKRFQPPPIALDALPRIDAVLISHDHYDHLDMKTIEALATQGTQFFVPLGVGAHLERWKVPVGQIHEREWWQEETLNGVRIICTPSRHYSARGLGDRDATLWSSWAAIGPAHRFYYSGDTGYSDHFATIGERLGPFDMSFIKIGAYGPTAGWIDIHMSAEDAVRANRDVKAKRMFPLHWATFNLAFHDWDEPIKRALAAANTDHVDLVTPRIGEMVTADQPFESQQWWSQIRSE